MFRRWAEDTDCVAFQWKLSTAHPVTDICDLYAYADLYGMGLGIFPKDKVPVLPVHLNCMCRLRPVMTGSDLLQTEHAEDRVNKRWNGSSEKGQRRNPEEDTWGWLKEQSPLKWARL